MCVTLSPSLSFYRFMYGEGGPARAPASVCVCVRVGGGEGFQPTLHHAKLQVAVQRRLQFLKCTHMYAHVDAHGARSDSCLRAKSIVFLKNTVLLR